MKYPLAAILALAAFPLVVLPGAAATLAPISPHQALANRGQCVVIEGTASVRSDPQRFGYDVDLDGKDSPAFGYIEPNEQAQFPDLNSLDGQRVSMTGVVQFYRGRAEIRLTSARQLTPASGDDSAGLTHIGPEFTRGNSTSVCG